VSDCNITHATPESTRGHVPLMWHVTLCGAQVGFSCGWVVGCNPTFAKNGRSGASPILIFVLNCYVIVMNTGICYVIVSIVHVTRPSRKFEILQSDWTAIFLQQNKSGYRAGTRPSVFREGRVTPD